MPSAERAAARVARRRRPSGRTPPTGSTATRAWAAKQAALEIDPPPAADRRPGSARSTTTAPARATGWSTSRPGARWPRSTARRRANGRSGSTTRARPRSRRSAHRLADRVDFHCWLQWLADEQLGHAQRTALGGGHGLGIVHDLAGRRAPGRRRRLGPGRVAGAAACTVGAPPDPFNQQGQDWSQPPLRPDRLAGARLRAVPRHAADGAAARRRGPGRPRASGCSGSGGCRRAGRRTRAPTSATTTRRWSASSRSRPQRAGAVVIGEDLGTVEPWVRDYLRDRGIFGTSILWFERDGRRPPARARSAGASSAWPP